MSTRKAPPSDRNAPIGGTNSPGDGLEDGRPHRRAGKTPEARANQLANLRSPGAAALKHGAFSAAKLEPEARRVLDEMAASFPSVRRDRLELAAHQRARIALLARYIETVGIIRNRQRGETYPALGLLQREEGSYRAELATIERLQDAAGNGPRRTSLQAITAELAAGDDDQAPDDAEVAHDEEGEK